MTSNTEQGHSTNITSVVHIAGTCQKVNRIQFAISLLTYNISAWNYRYSYERFIYLDNLSAMAGEDDQCRFTTKARNVT